MPGISKPFIIFITKIKKALNKKKAMGEKSDLDRRRLLAFWLSKLQDRRWIGTGQIYTAAGLALLTTVLIFAVIGGIRAGGETPPDVKQDRQAAVAEPIAVAKEASPQAVNPAAVIRSNPQEETKTSLPVKEAKAPIPAGEDRPLSHVKPVMPLIGEPRLEFGWHQHPVYNDWRFHTGMDLGAPEGTLVKALWDGKVTDIVNDRYTGLTVVVAGAKYTVYYGSLSKSFVEKNAYIAAGGVIGAAGTCAAEPAFPHLHLGIKQQDRYINPRELLDLPR